MFQEGRGHDVTYEACVQPKAMNYGLPQKDNKREVHREAGPFPADPVERFGGGDPSFLTWLVMGMPNKAR